MKNLGGFSVAALCASLAVGGLVGCGDGAVKEGEDFTIEAPVTSGLPSEFDITQFGIARVKHHLDTSFLCVCHHDVEGLKSTTERRDVNPIES